MENKKKLPLQTSNNLLKTKLLGWNTSYIYSIPGFLNVLEIVLCQVSIYLMNIACLPAYSSSSDGFVGNSRDVYFYVAVHVAEIITAIIFFAFIISESSRMLVEKTILVLLFWLFFFLALMAVSSYLFLMNCKIYTTVTQVTSTHKLVSSILGIVCSLLYSGNLVLAYKTCRNSWLYMYSDCLNFNGYIELLAFYHEHSYSAGNMFAPLLPLFLLTSRRCFEPNVIEGL